MTLELDGRQLTLLFSVNAVCDMEKALGESLYDMLKNEVRSVRALLWCGLLQTKDSMTIEETGALLERYLKAGGSLIKLSESLAQALDDAGFFR